MDELLEKLLARLNHPSEYQIFYKTLDGRLVRDLVAEELIEDIRIAAIVPSFHNATQTEEFQTWLKKST